MANIYELAGAYALLENAIQLNPDNESLVEELAKINDDIEVKAENYGRIIRNLEADTNALDAEIKRLTDRKNAISSNINRMKSNLMEAMKRTGKLKFKTELFSFNVQGNGGVKPLELTVKPEDLPKELQKIKIEADNTAIRKYIEETGDLSYAVLKERGQSLVIR